MCRPFVSKLLAVAAALTVAAGAHAAALVGATFQVAVAPAPPPALDRLKNGYRLPETVPFPASNPYTPEKAMLGRLLFYDPRLSASGALACASCHNPGFGYGDGQARASGDAMRELDRRSPSIIDCAWGKLFMWDGRAASLEEQALGPIQAPDEMNMPLDRMADRLSSISEYGWLFAAAFPHASITPDTVAAAIATYERTVVSVAAPFDAWIGGDEQAVPAAAKRGFALFNGKARCALCHAGWTFTDDGFHEIGLPDGDLGRGQLFPDVIKMQHAFKTPGLREVARRGPYMHDGSLASLPAVVAHYNQGGIDRPSRSELISPLGLAPQEQADIVAFLRTLTSPIRPDPVPALPR